MNSPNSSASSFPVANPARSEIQSVFRSLSESAKGKGSGERIRRFMNSPGQRISENLPQTDCSLILIMNQLIQCACLKLFVRVLLLMMCGSGVASNFAFASGWNGGIEGGTVVNSSGNQTRLRLTLNNETRPLTHNLYVEWLRGIEGSDGFSVGYNPRFWFNDKFYIFGESRLRTDETFAIDRELLLLSGVGGQLLNSEAHSMYVELGLGARRIEFESQEETTQGLGIVRLGYFRVLADLVKLDLDINGTQSEDDISEVRGEVGLSLRIPSGAIRYAYRSRSIKVGDSDTVTDDDSFISFTYGF